MTAVMVAPMREIDAESVARLSGQLGYPCTPSEIGRRLIRIAADPDAAALVARSAEDHVVGWIHVAATDNLMAGRRAEVWGLVVEAEERGRGIGHALLLAAERWAAERGLRTVRVRSNTVREAARRFYEREGYRLTKTQNHFHKVLSGERHSS